MKCEDVSKGLIAYLDRRTDSAERHEIEEHLAHCADCRARAGEFRGVWSAMDELPAVEPSFGFDARVRQRIAAEPQRAWFRWLVPQPRLAFAAALLVVLAVWVAQRPGNSGNAGIPGPTAAATEQDFNAIKDLGVLENYDVVTKMDALSELVPTAAQQPEKPQPSPSESND
ncbi:MAG TPA: zf-HC2 domain-containing protein [Verrucomicrobiae bacterium]|nr:zf-HC2 domain-containing protein [Verrucomicrobiae bacterium]